MKTFRPVFRFLCILSVCVAILGAGLGLYIYYLRAALRAELTVYLDEVAQRGVKILNTQIDVKGKSVRAGSTLTMDRALRNLLSFTGRPMEDVLPMLSQTPAALLGDSHLGAIAPGYDADFVLLDDAGNILQTYIQGKPHNI